MTRPVFVALVFGFCALASAAPCDSNPCRHGGICNDVAPNSYNCTCPPNVSGNKCQTAPTNITLCDQECGISIDECVSGSILGNGAEGPAFPMGSAPLSISILAAPTKPWVQGYNPLLVSLQSTLNHRLMLGFYNTSFFVMLDFDPNALEFNISNACVSSGHEYIANFGVYAYYAFATSGNGDVQMYVNGARVATCQFAKPTAIFQFYSLVNSDLTNSPLNSGFVGYLTRFSLLTRQLSSYDVAKIYYTQNFAAMSDQGIYFCPVPPYLNANNLPFLTTYGSYETIIADYTFTMLCPDRNNPGVKYAVCNGYSCSQCNTTNTLSCTQYAYGGATCVCVPGYAQPSCTPEADECASNPCQNGGVCTDRFNGYDCACQAGWTGSRCQTEIDECASNPCRNSGTCVDLVDGWMCECPLGTAGAICQTNYDECVSQPCLNGGTCVDQIGGYSCDCTMLYGGNRCQTALQACRSAPCQNGGSCRDDEGSVQSYTCTCPAGFTGPTCQTNIDECASSPCLRGGTCVDGPNGYTCTCIGGYSGSRCQTEINECASNPCMNGATCLDDVNQYNCSCTVGYSGKRCETNINECASFPCLHGGVCSDLINGYTCNCTGTGYNGTWCQIDVNECAYNNGGCSAGRNCTNIPGSRACSVCNKGFWQPYADMCLPCQAGAYSAKTNLTECALCEPGTANPYFGSSTCNNCTQGRFASNQGSSSCPSCGTGFYQPYTGKSSCYNCVTNPDPVYCPAFSSTGDSHASSSSSSSSSSTADAAPFFLTNSTTSAAPSDEVIAATTTSLMLSYGVTACAFFAVVVL